MTKKFLFWLSLLVAGAFITPAFAASSQTMYDYVDRYCRSMNPVDNCGTYQDEVDDAHQRGTRLMRVLKKYPAATQEELVDDLLEVLSRTYDRSSTGQKKFLSAYYYLMFMDAGERTDDLSSLIDFLFDDGASSYYDYDYDYDYDYEYDYDYDYDYNYSSSNDGELVNVRSNGRDTRVDNSRKRITVTRGDLEVRVNAEDDDGRRATSTNGYRVVALLDDNYSRNYYRDVYGATYDNGYRELSFGNSLVYGEDEMTILLLCENCRYGNTFSSDTVLDGWKIVDSITYDLSVSRTSSSSNYYYGNSREDLGIRHLAYDYDYDYDEVVVEITTTIENYGNDDTRLDNLEYSVEVDNDRFSSSKYDIRHIETDCDDSSVSRYDDEDFYIEEDDECEITVEFTFDEDDVDNEYVEIEVEIESRDDEYSPNNTRSVRFRVD